jgi:hypothetical protein
MIATPRLHRLNESFHRRQEIYLGVSMLCSRRSELSSQTSLALEEFEKSAHRHGDIMMIFENIACQYFRDRDTATVL